MVQGTLGRRLVVAGAWTALSAAGWVAGCAPSHIAGEPGPAYPMEAALLGAVDVHVLRDDTVISLSNTSGRALGPGTMWINGRYGREIEAIEPGASVVFRLASFRDEFGGAFRAGGFFALEPPDLVVRVEIEEPDGLTGLIVARGEGE